MRGVFTMDFSRRTNTANAFVTGIGGTRRIVLGDTLISSYTPEEVEVVMAHELGHHVHGDIWRGMAFDTVVTLIGLLIANLLLHAGVDAFGYRERGRCRGLPAPRAHSLRLRARDDAAHEWLQPRPRARRRCLRPDAHRQRPRLRHRDATPGEPEPRGDGAAPLGRLALLQPPAPRRARPARRDVRAGHQLPATPGLPVVAGFQPGQARQAGSLLPPEEGRNRCPHSSPACN